MKRRLSTANLAFILIPLASLTVRQGSAALIRSADQYMLTHVASDMRQMPRVHRYTVIPSGCIPSRRSRPEVSSIDGVRFAERLRRTTSLRAE